MPSLRQLEYLVALSETRHFRRAADRVGVTQPTLSAQLAELERRLGVQLVERSRSGVVLTTIGQQVLEHAQEISRRARAIRDLARSHQGGLNGLVRLGLPHTIGPYLLPYLIGPLHRAYPQLRLYVREDMPSALPDGLESGTHDLLILPVPVRNGDFESVALFREALHLIAPADHPLARAGTAQKAELRGEPILALGPGHQLRSQVADLCKEFGAKLLTSYEGTSLDTLRQMVGMGLGFTFLPDLYVRREIASDSAVRIVSLKGRALFRTIGLVWRSSSGLSAAFSQLASDIRETLGRGLRRQCRRAAGPAASVAVSALARLARCPPDQLPRGACELSAERTSRARASSRLLIALYASLHNRRQRSICVSLTPCRKIGISSTIAAT